MVFDSTQKILAETDLLQKRAQWRQQGLRLVATNGCFDLLHVGHVVYLEAARNLGDLLLVGVNGDNAVTALKGEGRPLNREYDRARLIAGLACVDVVFIFPEVRAVRFLTLAQPTVYVKGGDYSLETLHPEERAAVERNGGTIHLLSLVKGKSTTSLIDRIQSGPGLSLRG